MSNRTLPTGIDTAVDGISTSPYWLAKIGFSTTAYLTTHKTSIVVTAVGTFLNSGFKFDHVRDGDGGSKGALVLPDHDAVYWGYVLAGDIIGTQVDVWQAYGPIVSPMAATALELVFTGTIDSGGQTGGGRFLKLGVESVPARAFFAPGIPLYEAAGFDLMTAGQKIVWGDIEFTVARNR